MDKPGNIIRRILSWRFNRGSDQNENMKELIGAYKDFSSTPAGQIVLNDLLAASGVGNDPYVEGDPHGTSRAAGMQRIGLRVLSLIGSDMSQFVILEKEMRDESQQDKQQTNPKTANLGKGDGSTDES